MNYLKIFSISLSILLFVSCGDDKTTPEDPELPSNGNYVGTVSVAPGTPDAFILEDIEVVFTVSEDETTADIEMLKVKFADDMPLTLDMLMSGVTLDETETGYSISGDGIVPTAMEGRPFENYTITELTGDATTESLSIEMMCGEYPLSFEGTVAAE
jgi:hypothetical protein